MGTSPGFMEWITGQMLLLWNDIFHKVHICKPYVEWVLVAYVHMVGSYGKFSIVVR